MRIIADDDWLTLYNKGNALVDYNKAIKLAPNDYKGYYNRGLGFTEMGR
jgi:hypothetical protein